MARRSITDEEIALIKAMLRRGMKNKDIQFFFNRPDRPVNSGRITGIAGGTYAQSVLIPAATDETLDAFLSDHRPTTVSASVSVPAATALDAMDDATIASLFRCDQEGTPRLVSGEGDQLECKLGFGFKHAGAWLKAVAALANNRGGYVLFGVHDRMTPAEGQLDRSYELIGLEGSEFDADPAEFTRRLKASLDPTPRIRIKSATLFGKKLGVFFVEKAAHKPVIATRADGDLKEGDIYFRYPGQSSRIKYSDLRTLLDERDLHTRQKILPMVQKVLRLGPQSGMVVDLDGGQLFDGEHSILIDQQLVDRIKFIREGEFAEKDGAPTLRLVGDVQTLAAGEGPVRRKFVTRADLIKDFLQQQAPADPDEYIRCGLEGAQWQWFPIHYFAKAAGMDQGTLATFIVATHATEQRKAHFVDRARGTVSAYTKATSAPSVFRDQIEAGKVPTITSKQDAARAATAISNLRAIAKTTLPQLLATLTACFEADDGNGGVGSTIRRAVCRVDELFFGEVGD